MDGNQTRSPLTFKEQAYLFEAFFNIEQKGEGGGGQPPSNILFMKLCSIMQLRCENTTLCKCKIGENYIIAYNFW